MHSTAVQMQSGGSYCAVSYLHFPSPLLNRRERMLWVSIYHRTCLRTSLRGRLALLFISHSLSISDTIFLILVRFHDAVEIVGHFLPEKCPPETLWRSLFSYSSPGYFFHGVREMASSSATAQGWSVLVDGVSYRTAHLWKGSFFLQWAEMQFKHLRSIVFSKISTKWGVWKHKETTRVFLLKSKLNATL